MPGLQEPCALRRGRLVVVARVRRREVAIGKAFCENRFGLLPVQGQAFRLLVLFVPVETQPAQPFEDGLHAGLGVALHIGVVQPQHHGSVVVAGIEPIEDKGAGAADVQKAGGRRAQNAREETVLTRRPNQASLRLLSIHDATAFGSSTYQVEQLNPAAEAAAADKAAAAGTAAAPDACGAGTTFHSAKAST